LRFDPVTSRLSGSTLTLYCRLIFHAHWSLDYELYLLQLLGAVRSCSLCVLVCGEARRQQKICLRPKLGSVKLKRLDGHLKLANWSNAYGRANV